MTIAGFIPVVALSVVTALPAFADTKGDTGPALFVADRSNTLHIEPIARERKTMATGLGTSDDQLGYDRESIFDQSPARPPFTIFHNIDRQLNTVLVLSSGYGTLLDVQQDGRRNAVLGWMSGSGNSAAVIQSGVGNLVHFSQNGNGNSMIVSQSAW